MRFFQTTFLAGAESFVAGLERKTAAKLLYNIDLAEQTNDPKLFKKLQGEIWEFRTSYLGLQIRLLAFWDKSDVAPVVVVATHGFVKKVANVPKNEMAKAEAIRKQYFAAKAAPPPKPQQPPKR